MRGLFLAIVALPLGAGACSGGAESVVAVPPPATASPHLSDYEFVLESSCGERALLGRYAVVVTGERVSAVTSLNVDYPFRPQLADVPTLQGILDKARSAGPRAVVDLEVDEAGWPTSLMIDHVPRGVDDEECYQVSELRRLS